MFLELITQDIACPVSLHPLNIGAFALDRSVWHNKALCESNGTSPVNCVRVIISTSQRFFTTYSWRNNALGGVRFVFKVSNFFFVPLTRGRCMTSLYLGHERKPRGWWGWQCWGLPNLCLLLGSPSIPKRRLRLDVLQIAVYMAVAPQAEVEVTLRLTVSQALCLRIELPCGTWDQILLPVGMLLSEICGLVSVGRPV
jgi:hypothetical protein